MGGRQQKQHVMLKQRMESGCRQYLQHYPKSSWSHDQQPIVKYCLSLLSVLEDHDKQLYFKLLIILSAINKQLRNKHRLRTMTIMSFICSFGACAPPDTGKFKQLIEDGLCRLLGHRLYSERIKDYDRYVGESVIFPKRLFQSVKRGDIVETLSASEAVRTTLGSSVDNQAQYIRSIAGAAEFNATANSGVLALTLYRRSRANNQFPASQVVLPKELIDKSLSYIKFAKRVDEADKVYTHLITKKPRHKMS